MSDRLIFVSCEQLRPEEKRLGQQIKSAIDATIGFKAYFADTVQSLSGLSTHILDALRRCSGAVIVLHPRGEIRGDGDRLLGIRSSVWINQEVAILAYRHFFESRAIRVLAFQDPSITLEGAMTAFIINPKPFVDEEEVLAEGGRSIKVQSVRRRLIGQPGFEKNQASQVLQNRQAVLAGQNLVQLRQNMYDGDEMSLHPSWEWYIRHATGLASLSDGDT